MRATRTSRRRFAAMAAATMVVGLVGAPPSGAQQPPGPTATIREGAGPHAPGATVNVDVAGLGAGTFVYVEQCSAGTCGPYRYGEGTAGGTASIPFRLSRWIGRSGQYADCAVTACHLLVHADGEQPVAQLPVTVDPAAPVPRPQVRVTTPMPLPNLAVVAIEATGYTPGASVSVDQCAWTTTFSCRREVAWAEVATDGTVRVQATLRRMVGGVDCASAPGVCQVWMGEYGNLDSLALAGLRFDPTLPPPPVPTLAVDPAADLRDRQEVAVTVAGLDADTWASILLCAPGDRCRYLTFGELSAPSTTLPIVLPRIVSGVDCATTSCVVRVEVEGGDARLTAPVGFDPDAPLAPPPGMRVLPASGLWDGQRVEVRGERFDTNDYLAVFQCPVEPGAAGAAVDEGRCVEIGYAEVDGRGGVSAPVVVRRTVGTGTGTVDCAVETCSIALVGFESDTATAAAVSFDPDGPTGDPGGLPALPQQLPCVDWPTGGWPTGPIPAGVDAAAVAATGQAMIDGGASSVVVVHGGRLVYENYAAGTSADTIFASYSMSKSFTSTVVGLLIDDGLLTLDQPAPIPEWRGAGDPRGAISVRHLLNMASGLDWYEAYSGSESDVLRMITMADQAGYAIAKPLEFTPGTRNRYSTGDTMILARIIGITAGVSGESYRSYLHEQLFDHLGILPVEPQFDGVGTWTGGYATSTTTRNYAKLGLLYLRGGVWEDEQFLSREYVDFARSPSPASAGYGGQFWLNGDGSFSMIGLAGQSVTIIPQSDLVIAVNHGSGSSQMRSLFDRAAPPTCGAQAAAVDDTATVAAGRPTTVDVLANDRPGDGDGGRLAPATLTVADPPAHGTAGVVDGALVYEPAAGHTGPDQLTYVVCTADRRFCPEATVRLDVAAVEVDLDLAWPRPGTTTTTWLAGLPVPVVVTGDAPSEVVARVELTPVACDTGAATGAPVGATPRWTTFRWLGVHVAWVATEPTWSGCHRLAVVGTDGVARAATVRWLGGSVSP